MNVILRVGSADRFKERLTLLLANLYLPKTEFNIDSPGPEMDIFWMIYPEGTEIFKGIVPGNIEVVKDVLNVELNTEILGCIFCGSPNTLTFRLNVLGRFIIYSVPEVET